MKHYGIIQESNSDKVITIFNGICKCIMYNQKSGTNLSATGLLAVNASNVIHVD